MVRRAKPEDAKAIWELTLALAEFERLGHTVCGNQDEMARHLFGPNPAASCLLAEDGADIVGYAIYFRTFSTFRCAPGLWLEDLFVLPDHRGNGFGKELLMALASEAVRNGCGRMEWVALDWNEKAIAFYESLGAKRLGDWETFRLDGDALLDIGRPATD